MRRFTGPYLTQAMGRLPGYGHVADARRDEVLQQAPRLRAASAAGAPSGPRPALLRLGRFISVMRPTPRPQPVLVPVRRLAAERNER
jgi:hypothetical protein